MQNDKSKPIQNTKEKKNQMHEEEINKKCKGPPVLFMMGSFNFVEQSHGLAIGVEQKTPVDGNFNQKEQLQLEINSMQIKFEIEQPCSHNENKVSNTI